MMVMWDFQAKGRPRYLWRSGPTPTRDRKPCAAGLLSIRGRVCESCPKSETAASRLKFYSTLLPSRNACNYLKINGRCQSYPSRKWRAHLRSDGHNHADGVREFQIEKGPEPAYALDLSDS